MQREVSSGDHGREAYLYREFPVLSGPTARVATLASDTCMCVGVYSLHIHLRQDPDTWERQHKVNPKAVIHDENQLPQNSRKVLFTNWATEAAQPAEFKIKENKTSVSQQKHESSMCKYIVIGITAPYTSV